MLRGNMSLFKDLLLKLRGEKPTYEGFIAFCNEQDPNREINHRYWNTCAVGEYSKKLGASIKKVQECILEADNDLYSKFQYPYSYRDNNTYGDLQEHFKGKDK